MKLRALQLGYKQAEGAFLYVNGEYHLPFSFKDGTLSDRQTFILNKKNYEQIYNENEWFRGLIDSGDYIYDGCLVCINDPLYIEARAPFSTGNPL